MSTPDPNPRDNDLELVEVADSLAAEPPEDHEFHDHAAAEGEAWVEGDDVDDPIANSPQMGGPGS